MQINGVNNGPNFNGIKFKNLNEINLIQNFCKGNKLDSRFNTIYKHQLDNPVNIHIDKSDNPKYLLFTVGEKIFKANFLRSNIETLELASRHADTLNPNIPKLINYFA